MAHSLRMESLVALIGLAIVVFASTNIDDAFVLAATQRGIASK
jgi:hypothetical protein